MSIKELFDKTNKNKSRAANINFSELVSGSNVESAKQVSSYFKEASKVVPPINYGDPASFARFGTAEEYYKNAVNHIQQTYPYDGSSHEKSQWHLTASNLDNWVFDNVYPRTTGHAIFSPENTTVTQKSSDGYGNASSKEYITFYGGPHKDPDNTKLKDMFPSLGGTANIYKATQKRESNLKFDLSNSGVTVEFWLKKPFVSGSDKEVVFDMWNQATSSVAGIQRSDYGRLRIEITGAIGTTSPFLVTAISGTTGFQRAPIGSTLSAATLSDNEWKQFSFTLKNNGSNVDVELYQNGKLVETVTTGSSLSPVTGAMKAQLGSLLTEVSGAHSFGGTPDFRGWGKLSGSIDEFRYWKTKRNSKQIGGNWFTQVNGGTNTDTANTDLGVYYKFNEGVVGSGSTDSTVLDYSGRITNGTWTGYSAGYSRSLISALTTYNSDFDEFKDPIIYSSHSDVVDIKQQLRQTGSVHDLRNSSRMIGMIPGWIFEEEQDKERTVTKDMLQVVSSYFDELSTYITYLPKIKDQNYISSSHKPLPFAGRLLTNYGFDYSELFQNSTAIEEILNKNEDVPFSEKVHNIKNFLYTNIYNNLTQIYKAKGTTSAIRNLLHCMGIDEDLIKINTYADNVTYEIRDNVMDTAVYSRLADFNHAQRHDATVYQYTSSADTESTSFISGSGTAYKEMEGQGFTFESEIVFPRKPDIRTSAYENYDYPYLTASLFGMHTAQMQSPADTTWAGNGTTGDYANFQVYALRDSLYSKNVKFVLTGTSGGPIPLLTSSLYKDVYDDSRWNLAVRVVPTKHPLATFVAETSASTTGMEDNDFYNVEFYGVNYISDIINQEFHVSGTVKRKHIKNFMSAPKRTFVGAHYTNFTSSMREPSDVRVQSFRTWAEYLDNASLKAHARDVNNYGTLSPYQNTALFDASSQNNEIPQFANLMLHWNFDTLTGSNASGQFLVPDLTSGSSTYTSRYGWISGLLGNMHTGRGDFFGANDDGAVDVDWLPSLKQLPLESINSDDSVKILNDTDDKVFTQDSRPINHYFSIEKSMYQAISEEMINIFGTMKDFHNLIGQPVNRYRMNYKPMEKLRALFFERVQNTPDLDKYVNYFKWFDDAIGTMIANLIPASAKFNPEVNTVIESHALERNKYWNKFPTLEAKTSDPEASLAGAEELNYNWKFGHAPVPVPWSNKSILFASGSDQALTVADTTDLSFGDGSDDVPFSVSFWVKMDSAVSADQHLFSKGDGSSAQEYDVYFDHSSSRIVVKLQDGTNAKREWAEFPFAPATYVGAWTHIAITYNGAGGTSARNGITLYLNGESISAATRNGINYVAMENTSELFRISSAQQGSAGSVSNAFDGNIDEFIVYKNQALTAAQVVTLYNSGCPKDPTNISGSTAIVAYWKMGDGSDSIGAGATVIDSSGNNHHATPLNTPVIEADAPGDKNCRTFLDINKNCLWWNKRAERTITEISSKDTNTDNDKNSILNVMTTQISGSTYAKRALSRPYKLVTDRLNSFKPESKKYENKKKDFYKALTRPGNLTSLDIPLTEVKADLTCTDAPTPNELKKTKLNYKAGSSDTAHEYLSGKGDMFTPFTIFSASSDGYTKQLETFKSAIEINNMHQDTYGNMPAPMQGPFTEKHVGGAQHRHAPLNYWNGQHKTGSSNTNNLDGFLTRAESFNIVVSSTDLKVIGPDGVDNHGPHRQRATYYRDQTAKRPLNIKNIKMTASSPTKIGNYDHRYQYFHTSGRDKNNLWFRSGSTGLGGFDQPTASATAISGVIDFTLPDRSTLEDGSRNKTVFVERFSAPGGAEVQSRGYLDTESETYSVYNALPYRNLMVRTNLDKWNKHHSAFGGYDGVYGIPTASYHKIYRNGRFRIEQSGGVFITASVYDNGFIQRPIPQSDANYAWISASLRQLGKEGSSLFGYMPYSSEKKSDITLQTITSSEVGSSIMTGPYRFGIIPRDSLAGYLTPTKPPIFVHTDYAGINSNIYEPISSLNNFMGYPENFTVFSYVNAGPVGNDPITNDGAVQSGGFLQVWTGSSPTGSMGQIHPGTIGTYLNALLSHRQGPYGWPSWKQIRGAQHPVARSQKKNNILSINHISQQAAGSEPVYSLFHYTESALTVNRPLTHTLRVKDNIDQEFGGDGVGGTQQLVLRSTFGNFQQTFNNPDLKKKLGQIFRINEDTTYDKLLPYYGAGSAFINIPDESNPVDAFDNLKYSEIIYPRNKHMYLNIVRDRERFSVEYWRNDRTRRNEEFKLNSQGYTIHKQSIWPLDARNNFDTAATLEASSFNPDSVATGSEGELQNKYSVYHNGVHTRISASALYNRPIQETYGGTGPSRYLPIFAGDTLWEAGAGSSLNAPFYESYSDYAEDLRAAGKEYSIIPEFRISEHIQYYAKDKGGDFLADNPGFLTLTGSSITSSQMTDFYRTYSTTDFLKHFQLIRNDHNGVARAGEITLKCNALMKFLPYEGFYPAQRTTQMSTLFSQSYGPTLKTAGTQKNFRTALCPFYAPGIMYNSIKSGLAVDWPAHSASFGVANQSSSTPATLGIPRINERFHYRIPFEAILAPELNLSDKTIADCEPHVSANIDCTASINNPTGPLYSMAAHNFFAEVPKFFLKGQGLTTIASNSDFKSYMVEENEDGNPRIYSMVISLSHAELRTRAQVANAVNPMGALDNYASWYKNRPSIHNYVRTNRTGSLDSIQATGAQSRGKAGYDKQILPTEMRHGSSFGPAVQVSGNLCAVNNTSHEYSPYTPPYYDGYAELEYVFTPTFEGAHSLSDVLSQLEFRDFRMGTSNVRCSFAEHGTGARQFTSADPGSLFRYQGVDADLHIRGSAAGIAIDHAMTLTASINHAQIASLKNVKYDVIGNPIEVSDPGEAILQLAIQPKWECPILDFKDVIPSYPVQGSGSVSRGMWHQAGKIPTGHNGVFLTVQDTPSISVVNFAGKTVTKGGAAHGTGSLANLLGIEKKSHRLGELAQAKTVREAIVAIPYIRSGNGDMNFYSVSRQAINYILGDVNAINAGITPGKSLYDMVEKMQRYILPPQLDFVKNTAVDPFAMYIFEFSHTFNREDLANIWQNLPPESLLNIKEPKESTATISHALLADEIFGLGVDDDLTKMGDKTQWLVFKVKQQAEANYYAMTADTLDDQKFKFAFNQGQDTIEKAPEYSYNWPYDYFTMVEMAKMEVETKFEPGTDFVPGTKITDLDGGSPLKAVQPGPTKGGAKVIEQGGPNDAQVLKDKMKHPGSTKTGNAPGQGGGPGFGGGGDPFG